MSQLLQWRITIQHPRSREVLTFLGDGKTVAEAVADGLKTIGYPFRPKSDGQTRAANVLNVTTHDGLSCGKTLAEFESP